MAIKKMQGDGACLFRAVADQVYGDQEMHANVRRLCMDYIVSFLVVILTCLFVRVKKRIAEDNRNKCEKTNASRKFS